MPGTVVQIDPENAEEDLKTRLNDAGKKLVVIDFYADWCGPCKQIAPKLEGLAGRMSDVVFLKVNVDDCEELVSEYGVQSMPTFVFLQESKKMETLIGANATKLVAKIEELRSKCSE